MLRRSRVVAVGTAIAMLVGTGCGSSTKSTSAGSANGKTITVGVLADLTGPAASVNKTTVQGVQAGVAVAKQDGWTIRYKIGDTGTSPAGALSAAHKLVEVDHVSVVLASSALAFSAAPFLMAQHVPVVGGAGDSTEWITDSNMFAVGGAIDFSKVSDLDGKFMRLVGANNLGTIGYSVPLSSSLTAKAAALSARHAGAHAGYVNSTVPLGTTNVEPLALGMKNAGVDAFTASVDPNTGLTLIAAMRDLGVKLKAAFLPTGYGGDLLQAGPGAITNAQDVYFTTAFEPIEMNTPATRRFAAALKSVGVTADPTYAEYVGYTAVAMLMDALTATRPNPTRSRLTTNQRLNLTRPLFAVTLDRTGRSISLRCRRNNGG